MRLAKGAQQYISHTTGDSDNDALRPPNLPTRRKRASPELSLDVVSVCERKGSVGSSTYDKLGYEFDYKHISKLQSRPRPLCQRANVEAWKEREKKKEEESERASELAERHIS